MTSWSNVYKGPFTPKWQLTWNVCSTDEQLSLFWCLMHRHPWQTLGWSKQARDILNTTDWICASSSSARWALHHCSCHREPPILFPCRRRLLRAFVVAMCVLPLLLSHPTFLSFFLIESTGVDSSSRRAAERRGCVRGQRLDYGLWPMSKIRLSGACLCVFGLEWGYV